MKKKMTSTFNFRLPPELLRSLKEIANENGVDLASFLRMQLTRLVRRST